MMKRQYKIQATSLCYALVRKKVADCTLHHSILHLYCRKNRINLNLVCYFYCEFLLLEKGTLNSRNRYVSKTEHEMPVLKFMIVNKLVCFKNDSINEIGNLTFHDFPLVSSLCKFLDEKPKMFPKCI